MDDNQHKKVHIEIPFSDEKHAMITYEVLNVDEELKGSGIKRTINTDGRNLTIDFEGVDLKRLRTSVNASLKNISLIVKTFECFSY